MARTKEQAKEYNTKYYTKNSKKIYEGVQARVLRHKQWLWDYLLEHPCVNCGESDPVVLEFDHLRDKKFAISKAVCVGTSIPVLLSEIAKCQVLCANCHRRLTHKQLYRFDGNNHQHLRKPTKDNKELIKHAQCA